MPPERAFRVLREQSDRVSFRQVATIALACAGLGLGLSSAAEQYMHARPARSSRDVHAAVPVANAAVGWPILVAEREPRAASVRVAPADPRVSAPPKAAHRPLRLTRDRVSYLQCSKARAGAACRDRALEEHVWRALRDLPACYESATGRAELQLELQRDHAPQIVLSPPTQGPSLNLRAVRGCVEAPLRKCPNRISAEPIRVSFRFGLR